MTIHIILVEVQMDSSVEAKNMRVTQGLIEMVVSLIGAERPQKTSNIVRTLYLLHGGCSAVTLCNRSVCPYS